MLKLPFQLELQQKQQQENLIFPRFDRVSYSDNNNNKYNSNIKDNSNIKYNSYCKVINSLFSRLNSKSENNTENNNSRKDVNKICLPFQDLIAIHNAENWLGMDGDAELSMFNKDGGGNGNNNKKLMLDAADDIVVARPKSKNSFFTYDRLAL